MAKEFKSNYNYRQNGLYLNDIVHFLYRITNKSPAMQPREDLEHDQMTLKEYMVESAADVCRLQCSWQWCLYYL